MSYETEKNRYLIRKYLFMVEQIKKNPHPIYAEERIKILTNRINKLDEINKQLVK